MCTKHYFAGMSTLDEVVTFISIPLHDELLSLSDAKHVNFGFGFKKSIAIIVIVNCSCINKTIRQFISSH